MIKITPIDQARLCNGTPQFGMGYGINNHKVQPDENLIEGILN